MHPDGRVHPCVLGRPSPGWTVLVRTAVVAAVPLIIVASVADHPPSFFRD